MLKTTIDRHLINIYGNGDIMNISLEARKNWTKLENILPITPKTGLKTKTTLKIRN